MGKNQMCELEKSRCSGSCDRCGWNKRERTWREALLRKKRLDAVQGRRIPSDH